MGLRHGEPHVVAELTTAQRLHLGAWTVFAVFFGALIGVRVAQTGVHPLLAIGGGAIAMPVFLRLMMRLILGGSGRLAGQLFNPSGRRTPSRPGYSGPESLAVRGRFEEAIAAYEAAAADEPADPGPWLRVARIEKSELGRPRRALEALRAARARTAPDSPTAMLIAREMAELYLRDLGEPNRAMPELARIIENFGTAPTATWARERMKELKMRMMAGEFGQWVTPQTAHRTPGARPHDRPDSPPAPGGPEAPEGPYPDRDRQPPAPEREPEREREAPGPDAPAREAPPPGPEGPGPGPQGPEPR